MPAVPEDGAMIGLLEQFSGAPFDEALRRYPQLQIIRQKFRSDPLIAAAELRMSYREIGPELPILARAWLAQQQQQRREAELARKQHNERVAEYNSVLSSMGGSPSLQYESAGFSGPPVNIPDSMFWNTLDQVGTHRGHPPAPLAFRQRARDVALGKVDVWQALQLLCSEDRVAQAALPMLRQVLGPPPMVAALSSFEWFRDLSSWWEQTLLGKIASELDPRKHAWKAFATSTRLGGVLSVPYGSPFYWLYADLYADVKTGRANAVSAALREAASRQHHDRDIEGARDMAHVALYIASFVDPRVELEVVEFFVALGVQHADREALTTSLARIRPHVADNELGQRFARANNAVASGT
jgi:hypothetical protein